MPRHAAAYARKAATQALHTGVGSLHGQDATHEQNAAHEHNAA